MAVVMMTRGRRRPAPAIQVTCVTDPSSQSPSSQSPSRSSIRGARVHADGRFLDTLTARPWRAFLIFALAHAVLWTALPALAWPNLPLDLIEALVNGREFWLGYTKLPPLPWWITEIVYRLFGIDAGYYLISQIAIVSTFALVFALGLRVAGPIPALVAVLMLDGLHYFGFTAPKFNHDVVQLPFWALAGYAFHRALRGGGLAFWVLLGLAFGGAFWSKYFAVMLMAPMALFLLAEPQARRMLATPGPYVTALVALLIATPHLVWLVNANFLPFSYAEARAVAPRHVFDHLLRPAAFLLGQLAWAIPALLIALPLIYPRQPRDGFAVQTSAVAAFDRRILALLAFGPIALLTVASLVSGRLVVAMWGYPLFLFTGLWAVVTFAPQPDAGRAARTLGVWASVTVVYAVAFLVSNVVMPHFDRRYRAVLFPGRALAQEISRAYTATTGAPLAYVVGHYWPAGNISHYAPDRPRVVGEPDPARVPWIDMADLRRRGGVLVWSHSDPTVPPADFAGLAPNAQVQPPLTRPLLRGGTTVTLGWAIIPPGK
jgi:4-amino-4-deoxy-L-arabinose transferase-like glycosyltransferase